MRQVPLTLALLLLAAGCAVPGLDSLPPDAAANSEETVGRLPVTSDLATVPAGQAVVVVGVAARQPRSALAFGWRPVESGWIAIDPATGRRSAPIMPEILLGLTLAGRYPSDGQVTHLVFTLPPGSYALGWLGRGPDYYFPSNFEWVTSSDLPLSRQTTLGQVLFGVQTRTFNRSFSALAKAEPVAPTFELGAGEIVYVGEILFDLTDAGRLTWRQGSDPDAARAALQRAGLQPGAMAVRPWHRFDGKPPGDKDGIARDELHMAGRRVAVE